MHLRYLNGCVDTVRITLHLCCCCRIIVIALALYYLLKKKARLLPIHFSYYFYYNFFHLFVRRTSAVFSANCTAFNSTHKYTVLYIDQEVLKFLILRKQKKSYNKSAHVCMLHNKAKSGHKFFRCV